MQIVLLILSFCSFAGALLIAEGPASTALLNVGWAFWLVWLICWFLRKGELKHD